MNKTALFIGSIISGIIAIVHIIAIFIGAAAYRYLDAPELAVMAENGSWVPAILTCIVTLFFVLFSAYALSEIGLIRPLPFRKKVIPAIGLIYTLRGLGIIWFIYLVVIDSEHAIPREIGFSLVSLIAGLCYLYPSMIKKKP
mgnify:CR=1 FL=1|tara:strand:- start:400 stop:825 length:426 start_codon:yes stop_codon:yes gene_type:complete